MLIGSDNKVMHDAIGCGDSGKAIDLAGAHVSDNYGWLKVAVLALDQAGLRPIEKMIAAAGHEADSLTA